MLKEIRIETMTDLGDLLFEIPYNEDIHRSRDHFVYRGVNNTAFAMQTSLQRFCKDQKDVLEPIILKNFTKYAEMENPHIRGSVWRQMILGQHHGLPTRLLDWSLSPLIALHFATEEPVLDAMEAHDCAVWKVDVEELAKRLPEKYLAVSRRDKQTIFSVDMLTEVCSSVEQYDEDMQDQNMLVMEPPSIDKRITNQFSFFSIVPKRVDNIETFLNEHTENTVKYVIAKDLRWEIRDMLDKDNINERIVYPGLDGIAQWLARHYFVRYTESEKK